MSDHCVFDYDSGWQAEAAHSGSVQEFFERTKNLYLPSNPNPETWPVHSRESAPPQGFSWIDDQAGMVAKTFGADPKRDPVNSPSLHSQRSIAMAQPEETPDRARIGAWLLVAAALLALIATILSGCSTVSAEAKSELNTNAAVGAGVYKDWETLSDVDKKRAYWGAIRCLYDLKFSIYGDEIPETFNHKSWTPTVVTAPTVGGGK